MKAERSYYTTKRELTSIVLGCKQFRQYIWGRKFTTVTDHKLLTWIFKMNDPSSWKMRLKLKLQESANSGHSFGMSDSDISRRTGG